MSARKVIGGAMLSTPLVVSLAGVYREHGWFGVASVVGVLALVVGGAALFAWEG